MAGVLGIDIGSSMSIMATIQRRAVDIVRNDLSERATSSLVSFTAKDRLIGEAAKSQLKSNFMNTCRNIKTVLSCTANTSEDLEYEKTFSLCPLALTDEGSGSQAGYQVNYRGEESVISATSCLAALLGQLKSIAEKSTESKIRDVVIAIPGWYPDHARHSVIQAAEIAGLSCVKTMNEHAAVVYDYGMYRAESFSSETATRVAFVSIGNSTSTVFVADFHTGEARVVSVASNRRLGGRNFDRAIVEHFAKAFQNKYNQDPLLNRKALVKLEEAATKAKKILSANSEASCSVECLMGDNDLVGSLDRDNFENLCEGFKNELQVLLLKAFEQIPLSSLNSVEIIGGCVRIPWVQRLLSDFFGPHLPLGKTLNMDETVARGCALQAAMLNTRFRVREYKITDWLVNPVTVSWLTSTNTADGNPEMKTTTLFDHGCSLDIKKWLTFQRSAPFDVHLSPKASFPLVVHVEPPASALNVEGPQKFKLKARLTTHGTVCWEAANFIVEEEVEETIKKKIEPVEGSATPPEEQFEEVVQKVVKARSFDCTLTPYYREGVASVDAHKQRILAEADMAAADKIQRDTKEMMNNCESFIYKYRGRLTEELADFVSEEERVKLTSVLQAAEDWIYENTEATLEVYSAKLTDLERIFSGPDSLYNAEIARQQAELAAIAAAEAEAAKAEADALAAAQAEAAVDVVSEEMPVEDVNMEPETAVE